MRVTDERVAAMALYGTRSRDALIQRLDVQANASQPSGRRLADSTTDQGEILMSSCAQSTPSIEMRAGLDVTGGNEAAERAQAYVALLSMLGFEVDALTLGTVVEKWALIMAGSHVRQRALIAALKVHRERIPLVSLIRACVILDLDIRDVMADALADDVEPS
jgi:hypothetical protein